MAGSKPSTEQACIGSCIEEDTSFLASVAFDMVGAMASSCRINPAVYLSGKMNRQSLRMTLDDIITIVESLLKYLKNCHDESLKHHHLPLTHLIES